MNRSFWINAHRVGLLPDLLERFDLSYAPALAQLAVVRAQKEK